MQKPNAKSGQPVGKVELAKCSIEIYPPQNFIYTKHGFLMSDESVCLDVNEASKDSSVLLLACSEFKRQKWKYDPFQKLLKHVESDLCLDVVPEKKTLTLHQCSENSKSQLWEMIPIEWQ